MSIDPARYRRRDYLPFARHFFGDVAAFRRHGCSWSMAIRSAIDYWHQDRALGI
jgi:hypothetical protein